MKGLVIALAVLLAIAMPSTAQDTETAYVYATVGMGGGSLEFISVPSVSYWQMTNPYGWNSYSGNPLSVDFNADVDWTLSVRDPAGNGHMVGTPGELSDPFNLYYWSGPDYDLYLSGTDQVLGMGAASASAISYPVEYWQWLNYDPEGDYSISILYSLTPSLILAPNEAVSSRPAPVGR